MREGHITLQDRTNRIAELGYFVRKQKRVRGRRRKGAERSFQASEQPQK